MKRLPWLVVCSTLAAPAATAQVNYAALAADRVASSPRRSLRIVITHEVHEALEALADTLRVETVRCLIGAIQGDSILVDLAWTPPIGSSTPGEVEYQPCPAATTILWHNHPWNGDVEPEFSCYMSQIDIRAALRSHAPPVQMVQVTPTVACWWTRVQVALQADAAFLLPVPSQGRGQLALWSTVTCSAKEEKVLCERSVLSSAHRRTN